MLPTEALHAGEAVPAVFTAEQVVVVGAQKHVPELPFTVHAKAAPVGHLLLQLRPPVVDQAALVDGCGQGVEWPSFGKQFAGA